MMPYRADLNDGYHLPPYANTTTTKRPRHRRCFAAVLAGCLLGALGATLASGDAHAYVGPSAPASHVIAPHSTWRPANMASPVEPGWGLNPPLVLSMAGRKLTRACPVGYALGTSSCRYYQTRPYSACRAICPMRAIIPGFGRHRIINLSNRRLRVTYRRWLPCPECGE